MSDWGQGSKNNDIGWGKGAVNNDISWGASHKISWAGDTEIVGTDGNVPINVVAPVISGNALVGNTLTSTTGTWTSDTGVTGYLYQWTRDGVNISGATNSTYTLVSADLNTNIICKVAATDTDGTSAYVNSNSLVVYDSDYKAVLDYATTQGYTLPSVSQRLKQSVLLSSLKTAGVWSKLDSFANFATDGDVNYALIDWKRLSQYTAVNSPTFTTNQGYSGNGTSSYIDTNFNPSLNATQYKLNNASIYTFLKTLGTGLHLFGNVTTSLRNAIFLGNTTGFTRLNSGTSPSPIPNVSNNLVMKSIHRQNATDIVTIDELTSTTSSQVSSIVPNANQFVLRSGIFYSSHTISMFAMGASLITENTAFVNAYNTYINSL